MDHLRRGAAISVVLCRVIVAKSVKVRIGKFTGVGSRRDVRILGEIHLYFLPK